MGLQDSLQAVFPSLFTQAKGAATSQARYVQQLTDWVITDDKTAYLLLLAAAVGIATISSYVTSFGKGRHALCMNRIKT